MTKYIAKNKDGKRIEISAARRRYFDELQTLHPDEKLSQAAEEAERSSTQQERLIQAWAVTHTKHV
ncbi:hypothetical protein [Lysinibacter cavernae]|uniref:Uncharacterized protein n=1 Tax=Lysinibacter cavernae TaxID=1640652 RepID=A0A7X5QZC5_9MICO|nr:hypothetical protein [Lysinibacter cavernae]NIH52565.1 hypothetical protein [Lysinibacter cavernae]